MGSFIAVLGNSSRALLQAVWGAQPLLSLVPGGRLAKLAALIALFSRSDEASETLLAEKFSQLQFQGDLTEYELKALDRLRDIMALRSLNFAAPGKGKTRLRQGFVVRAQTNVFSGEAETNLEYAFNSQDITESATVVAKLYWKLFDTCTGTLPELQPLARQLYFLLFGVPFEPESGRARILRLTDALQRDSGVPFLILNLLRQGALHEARLVGRLLLADGLELEDPDRASALYWLTEIAWFQNAWGSERLTHEATLRFLYHLCFTSPDRAGFLEIDSPFFSEFETVSELAHEALTYRETLVESLLALWEVYDGEFDPIFQKSFETLVGRASKIYDHRASWEKLWRRSQESFSRDYLFVVEGNQCYLAGMYADAAECFETALEITPGLRAALSNLAIVYAKLGRVSELRQIAEQIQNDRRFGNTGLLQLGDAYLLAGLQDEAEVFFEDLRHSAGSDSSIDYAVSTFCALHGLSDLAVEYAQRAFELAPEDAAVAYHLSLCLEAAGQKEKALLILKQVKVESEGDSLHYYRFTLERDLGNDAEAAATLIQVSRDFLESEGQWEEALRFAKMRQDIGLLRHLKQKKDSQD